MNREKKKILIIDDGMEDHKIWTNFLSSSQDSLYEFYSAYDGITGISMYEKIPIDCALLDYNLPDYNSLEVIQEIQSKNAGALPYPIIVLTGEGDEVVAAETIKMGASDYLAKDRVTSIDLVKAVKNAIDKHQLYQQLEEKKKDLQKFVSIVAHDLKAPMNRANVYCDMLKKTLGANLDEKSIDYIKKIEDDLVFSIKLISDLMEYANHIPRSRKPLTPIDLNKVLERAKNNLEISIQEKKAVIQSDALPIIMGDEVGLVQLFQNLIGNALKFFDKELLQIKITASHKDGNHQIRIQDNGIGIDPKYYTSIFEPFKRLHSRSDYPGSGIGLATCKMIVEQHKGTIIVRSEPGKGSTFIISFPMLKNKKAA